MAAENGGADAAESDQYSLAVTYCLLRGGALPFEGRMARLMACHLQLPPDLTGLNRAERPVVARALAKKPSRRWPSCREFVAALSDAVNGVEQQPEGGCASSYLHSLPAASLLLALAKTLMGLPRILSFINRQFA